MITDMQSTHVCPLVTGISNHVVGSSEVLGGVLCLLISCFGFIIILFQCPIGFASLHLQVMSQVCNGTHTCTTKFVSP